MASSKRKTKVAMNPKLRPQIVAGVVKAVDEIDLRIETESKKQLYKGHGVITGTLKRDIQTAPARVQGNRVVGQVGTSQVTKKYAMQIHRRYLYLLTGFQRVKPQSRSILERHVKQARRG